MGLFAISPATILPGMTTFVAAIILLIALQMALGLAAPVAAEGCAGPQGAAQTAVRLPRTGPPQGRAHRRRALEGTAGVLATFPLSFFIPFAPLAPGIAVVLFGLGMTARDGVCLSLGMALTAGAFWLALPLVFRVIPG